MDSDDQVFSFSFSHKAGYIPVHYDAPPPFRKEINTTGRVHPGVLGQKQGCKLLGHRDLALGAEPGRNNSPRQRNGPWTES